MYTTVLFSYHADFATSEYFAKAIVQGSDGLVRVGTAYQEKCMEPDFNLPRFLDGVLPRCIFFVDPPGPQWPTGFESLPVPSVAYMIDVHLGLEIRKAYAPFFDYIFIAQKDYLDDFRKEFEDVYWLPLACDPQVHRKESSERSYEVGFVGQMGSRGSFREKILSNILPRFTTNEYRKFYSPHEMAEVYSRSKIVLNASINGDLNMRFFEALASGALLVTDRIGNGLPLLFQEGVHYIGYSTVEEAAEKIRYYLDHLEEREQIAREGQKVAISRHTYLARWNEIMAVVGSRGNKMGAPIRTYPRGKRLEAYAKVYDILRVPSALWRMFSRSDERIRDRFLAPYFLRAAGRKLNSIIPLTPGAIRARMGRR